MYSISNRSFVSLILTVLHLSIQPGPAAQTMYVEGTGDNISPSEYWETDSNGSNDVRESNVGKVNTDDKILAPKAEITQLGDTFVIIKIVTPAQIGDGKYNKTRFKVEVAVLGSSSWRRANKAVHVSESWANSVKGLPLYNMEVKCSGLRSGRHYRISSIGIVYHDGNNRLHVGAYPSSFEFTTKALAPKVKLTPGPLIINLDAKDAVKYFVEVKKENDPDCFINITVSAQFSKSLAIPGLAKSETYLIKVWYQDVNGQESAPVSETHTIVFAQIVI